MSLDVNTLQLSRELPPGIGFWEGMARVGHENSSLSVVLRSIVTMDSVNLKSGYR